MRIAAILRRHTLIAQGLGSALPRGLRKMAAQVFPTGRRQVERDRAVSFAWTDAFR
jgi:hypothetical protein